MLSRHCGSRFNATVRRIYFNDTQWIFVTFACNILYFFRQASRNYSQCDWPFFQLDNTHCISCFLRLDEYQTNNKCIHIWKCKWHMELIYLFSRKAVHSRYWKQQNHQYHKYHRCHTTRVAIASVFCTVYNSTVLHHKVTIYVKNKPNVEQQR